MRPCPLCGPASTKTGTMVVRGCRDWDLHRGNFVTMFRQPEQRVISSYNHGRHDCTAFRGNLTGYAEKVSGCYVRMLTGRDCACSPEIQDDSTFVQPAIERLQTGF